VARRDEPEAGAGDATCHRGDPGADPRLRAYVKYGTVTFAYGGDLAAFVQPKGKSVSLMFNRGARIPGEFPHLEGDGPTARFMRFVDKAEVEARADELADVARA